ncbi:MAG: thymidine phosphorylase [Clostridia bacterium]|nr:thymidine phosphorylase [Clostridia bacterium]
MTMYELIQAKRRGEAHTDEALAWLIRGVTDGSIPDYQLSAWLMAVCLRGMNARETATMTACMAASGDQIDLSPLGAHTADKHSTGGVGDKTTLIVAPLAAALGCTVAKMSGRGLGHTGGTIDKLESISGFRTSLSPDEFFAQVERIGVAVVGQTGNLAPADKKLYALRDVTATVDSIPLIASSVMSKKLAAGAQSIVLDVKVGSGAFMKTREEGKALARAMVEIGQNCGRKIRALVTNMDVPLGYAIGNALEVAEAIEILQGRGCPALREICLALAANMYSLSFDVPADEALAKATTVLDSGEALAKFRAWIAAQGGDVACADDPAALGTAKYAKVIETPHTGWLVHMDAERIGRAAMLLGAGRATQDDVIDPLAGIRLAARTGDAVTAGAPLATLYTSDKTKLAEAEAAFLAAVELSNTDPGIAPLIYCTVGN